MEIASFIEHTNLSPTLVIGDIDRLVEEAVQFSFYGICVPPFWVQRARREISGRNISLVTVAGFPFGYSMTETKIDEIRRALDNGADEVDVVWNISSFKTGSFNSTTWALFFAARLRMVMFSISTIKEKAMPK